MYITDDSNFLTDTTTMKHRILNADVLRVLALFAVVGIHLLNPIYARPDFFNGKFWWICFLLNALFRASVPLFVLLSGYLLLGKPTTIAANLSRTWKRILVPLISFFLIGTAFKAFLAFDRGSIFDVTTVFHNLSTASGSYLYFLVIIAFLYVLIPLLQRVFQKDREDISGYMIKVFFCTAVLATIARYTSLRTGDIFNTFTIGFMWIGYFLLGYWIRLHQEELVKYRRRFLMMFGVGFLITLGLGYWSWAQHWAGNDALFISGITYPEEYLSINVIMMSVAVFVLILTTRLPSLITNNAKIVRLITILSELSFGVYLIHVVVMDILNNFFGITADSPLMPGLPAYVLINSCLTLALSLSLTAVVRKTPYLRKIVGF